MKKCVLVIAQHTYVSSFGNENNISEAEARQKAAVALHRSPDSFDLVCVCQMLDLLIFAVVE